MYQKTITEREAGQRFDKYLHKLLPEAGNGFLYKMLRKKNIVLNGKKAEGSEKISPGDVVTVYFQDETLQKFMGKTDMGSKDVCQDAISVLYENSHVLLADKPAGILTQKAAKEDLSFNECLIAYLLGRQAITPEELRTFKPSACNRLDRNTSGIVLCAKTVQGAQMLSDLLKTRSLHKFYRLYVKGTIAEEKTIEGYLYKDEKHNTVTIDRDAGRPKASYICTRYLPIRQEADKTLLEVELITGKSHQIRAHLSSIGHPLLGDYKYGDRAWNEKYRQKYDVNHQLLHAYRVVFPPMEGIWADLSERAFMAPMPEIFGQVADDGFS
ncbi:MAG: RluA family pseudouridine synthase [Lachnospiraceae bacterium]|nr:RluA family pseudouridine synthase [Lachnospiraceae bacterium]